MCLIALALNVHPDYPVILCANRDEFHNRPSANAHFWEEDSTILAGRDLEKGGTWLGVTTGGKLAAVTNVRQPETISNQHLSRGDIPANFLKGNRSPLQYEKHLRKSKSSYLGFNAFVAEMGNVVYFSNKANGHRTLSDGYYTLSNADLETEWHKTYKLKTELAQIVHRKHKPEPLINDLLLALQDERQASDDDLPHTGIGTELERTLSPIFINGPEYGTRASTVVLQSKEGIMYFTEQTYGPSGIKKGLVSKRILLEK